MSRTADYSIQGFLYQFHKTLIEILKANDDDPVSIEGIIEDIEVATSSGMNAIQCKYHESKTSFTLSTIYKPLLQMMEHYHNNKTANISYTLFVHFPAPQPNFSITQSDLAATLQTSNGELQKYCLPLRGNIDLAAFHSRLKLELGPPWDEMVRNVHIALEAVGMLTADIPTIFYPNAIQRIADLSIIHDATKRTITRRDLVNLLNGVKSTAISRWTLALKSRKQILEARKKQLAAHLAINARLRYLIFDAEALADFDDCIIGFIGDFLTKYHFKLSHIKTPVLCLDTTPEIFRDLQLRLFRKGILVNHGFIGDQFDENHFFREPMVLKNRGMPDPKREFHIRLMRWDDNGTTLGQQKPNDLFICGRKEYAELDTQDVIRHHLETATIKEFAFILNLSASYE